MAEEDMNALDDQPAPTPEPPAPAAEPGRVLTMEEMMAISQQQMAEEDMDALNEPGESSGADPDAARLEGVLHDFRDLYNDRAVTLAELAIRRRERAAQQAASPEESE
jgi:hypothetical protein